MPYEKSSAARPALAPADQDCRHGGHCLRFALEMSPAAPPTCNGSPWLAKASVPVPPACGEGATSTMAWRVSTENK